MEGRGSVVLFPGPWRGIQDIRESRFMDSGFDHMLFVDSDVEFEPEAVLRMLVPKEFIVCTPYRVKEDKMKYAVKFKNPDKIKIMPWDMVDIEEGPA